MGRASKEKYYDLAQNLERQMGNLNLDSKNKEVEDFLKTFLEFGMCFDECCEDLPDTALLDFTTKNKNSAQDICPALGHYFTVISSAIFYVYEDADEAECKLAEICSARSGLEYFVEFFEARLRELNSAKFEEWYNSDAAIPSFDKTLREKIGNNPILRKYRIPEDVPDSHWWWQLPSDW